MNSLRLLFIDDTTYADDLRELHVQDTPILKTQTTTVHALSLCMSKSNLQGYIEHQHG